MKPNNSLTLMICYARSGGTLLNRMLAALPNTIVMSEVNPLGGGWGINKEHSHTTIKAQSKAWYNISLKSRSFSKQAKELLSYSTKHGKRLIIRDWSYINFSPHTLNQYNPPNKLLTVKELAKLSPTTFAFVRNAIDIWISMGKPDIHEFGEQYLQYIKNIRKNNVKLYKYEDLCMAPDRFMNKLVSYLRIPFSNEYKNFNNIVNVNGDVQLNLPSQNKISLPSRKYISPKNIYLVETAQKLKEANQLCGYNHRYLERGVKGLLIYIESGIRAVITYMSLTKFNK